MTVPHAALLFGFGAMTLVAVWMLARDLIALLRAPTAEGRGS